MTANITATTTRSVLSVAVAALVVLSMASGLVAAAGTTNLTVSAADGTLATGETTTVTVAVSNADGGVGSADFRVELTDPSVATITGVTLDNGPAPAFTTVEIDADGNGANVNYAVSDSPDTGQVTIATVTLTADAVGTTDVNVVDHPDIGTLDVGDEQGTPYTLDDIGSATLTVEEPTVNEPPTADAGDDQTVDEDTEVTLDASGSSDPDDDALSYAWTQTGGTGVSLSDASAAQPTFTAPTPTESTTLTFELDVSDGDLSDTDTVNVTVEPVDDEAPAISDFDVSASGQDVDVSFQSNEGLADIDVTLGDDASGTLTESDFTETQSGGTYTYTADVSEGQDGTFSATLDTAADAAGNDGANDQSDSVTVDTPPANQDPSASFTVDPSSAEVGETVSFDAGDSSDADGSIESYEWDFDDGETAAGEQVTHDFDSAGDYLVELTVTDDDGATDSTTQTVSVTEAPDPASFQVSNLNAPTSATQGTNITVSADVTNEGGSEATQTVEFRVDADGDGTLDGGEALTSQAVTLDGGETQTVTFSDLDTSILAPGEYAHGVFTDDDSASETITIEEPGTPVPETSVSLSPDSSEVVIGDTETYDVVVDDADGGVGAYEFTVSIDDASVASITDVTIDGSTNFTDVSYAENDSSVTVTAALIDTDDTGSVSIGSITVEGTTEGSSGLSLDVAALGNEAGESYAVTDETGASVSVIELPPVGEFQNSPTDPDGDGLYEDVNGDGEFNINDVQALFANQGDETIQNNPDEFDFNQDGVANVVDVQKLFNEVLD